MVTAWLSAQLLLLPALGPGMDVLADGVVDGPEPEDVKAGWTAFALFLLLALAVVVLGRSLVVQLRKAQRAADSGVYGERPGPDAAGGGAGGAEGAQGTSEPPRQAGAEQGPDTPGGDPPRA